MEASLEVEKVPVVKDPSQVVDYWRQLALFDPFSFKKEVHVVGAGALGSHFVDTVTNMGVFNVTAYDFDRVEGHNLPNQIFGIEDVGLLKVEALYNHVLRKTGIKIKTVSEKVEKIEGLSGILVLCVDTISGRKSIAQQSAFRNEQVDWVLEMRMGIAHGTIHFFDPNNHDHRKRWLATMPLNDEQLTESACNSRAIASTAKALAAVAAHKIVQIAKPDPDIPVFNCTDLCTHGFVQNSEWSD